MLNRFIYKLSNAQTSHLLYSKRPVSVRPPLRLLLVLSWVVLHFKRKPEISEKVHTGSVARAWSQIKLFSTKDWCFILWFEEGCIWTAVVTLSHVFP